MTLRFAYSTINWGTKCDLAAMFDRCVADTALRCHGPIGQNGLGRASLDASGTAPAPVGNLASVDVILERGENCPQKKVRPLLRIDEHAVFPDPADSALGAVGPVG